MASVTQPPAPSAFAVTPVDGPALPFPQDLYVAEALSTLESWRSRYNQVVKDKGDLELEIIVLNEYVCAGRGCTGRRREVGMRWEELRTRGRHITHVAAIWSLPVKGCIGLRCGQPGGGLSSWTPGPGSSPSTQAPAPQAVLGPGCSADRGLGLTSLWAWRGTWAQVHQSPHSCSWGWDGW